MDGLQIKADDIPVRQLMTSNPIVVEPDVTVERVLAIMREASIRHVPVVDESGILGVVSDRDLTFIHGIPGVFDVIDDDDVQEALDAPVSVVMKSRFLVGRDVVTIGRDEPVQQAVNIFVGSKLGALPVVDESDSIVGVLSSVDVLRWLADDVFV